MIDFTSALYLGLCHASRALPPWHRLTTGAPAALRESPAAGVVASELATLMGCERATLSPSTLHLFWDLLPALAGADSTIYMDAGLYPIARWGIERAAAQGVPVRRFPHHGADALRRGLAEESSRRRPLIVTDGFCPRCGRPAPLAAYVAAARHWGGRVVIDDTQALGVLGPGGGGLLARNDSLGPDVLVVASLAKGLGVPVAVLAGSADAVSRFEATSETRVHCSPPSVATIHAAWHALVVNRSHGDALRARLASLVGLMRRDLCRAGFPVTGGVFPVQTLADVHGVAACRLHRALTRQRVLTVLRQDAEGLGPRLTLLLTARHTPSDIATLVQALTHRGAP